MRIKYKQQISNQISQTEIFILTSRESDPKGGPCSADTLVSQTGPMCTRHRLSV